jgi:hypothetical protein
MIRNAKQWNRNRPQMLPVSLAVLFACSVLSACGGSSGYNSTASTATPPPPPPNTIGALQNNVKLASTVAPNGDQNPYFIATPPASFTGVNATSGVKTVLQPGDLLISDFSSVSGANNGTSIMRYTPGTGAMSLFYQEKIGTGPVGGAISGLGTLWIANFQPGYSNTDGATTGDGNVVVVSPNGTDFPNGAGIIDNNSGVSFSPNSDGLAGPWGQQLAVKAGTTTPYFFVTNVNAGKGYIQRQAFTAGKFNVEAVTTIGLLPTGTNAFDPTGPQGMAYDATNDILYVANAANNQIVAFTNATTATAISSGTVVFQGAPLNAPIGLAINPINGDLITVNQLDNNMVEISSGLTGTSGSATPGAGAVVGVKLLDSTPVNTTAATGSALFGLLATKDSNGNLNVYYSNSNANSLNVLK